MLNQCLALKARVNYFELHWAESSPLLCTLEKLAAAHWLVMASSQVLGFIPTLLSVWMLLAIVISSSFTYATSVVTYLIKTSQIKTVSSLRLMLEKKILELQISLTLIFSNILQLSWSHTYSCRTCTICNINQLKKVIRECITWDR